MTPPADDGVLGIDVRSNLAGALRALREFDPKLLTEVRKQLRVIGNETLTEMRSTVLQPPPEGRTRTPGRPALYSRRLTAGDTTRSRGSRQAIAQGLKVTIPTGAGRGTRASIRLSGVGTAFPRAYNREVFRHPIRFDPATTSRNDVRWVEQSGRPYFGRVIVDRGDRMRSQMIEALENALAAIARS